MPTKSRTYRESRSGQAIGVALRGSVRLHARGLAKVLGDLEARVMRAMWDLNRPVPAREVHESVARTHPVRLLTVVTVLNKLVRKGLLRRRRRAGLLHYETYASEREFMAAVSRRVVEGVLSLEPNLVAVSFVDVLAQRDPVRLKELGRLVRRKLRERER